jgi:predicted lipoprotein with Yx(FWY)xxD motif
MRRQAIRWALPLVLLASVGVGAALAATASRTSTGTGTVSTAKSAKFGTILVAKNGRTLYRYTLDKKGVNKCTAVAICRKYWPQLLLKAGAKPTVGGAASAGLVGTIKAKTGWRQVTYAGYPLYTFAGDSGAGQVKGQGFQSQWYVVNNKGAFVKHAVSGGGGGGNTTTTTGSSWG